MSLRRFLNRYVLPVSVIALLLSADGYSQSQQPTDASALLTRSLNILNSGNNLSDVTVQGNTIRVIGKSNQLGTITLRARLNQGRADWQLGPIGLSLVLNAAQLDDPSGSWVDPKGQKHSLATHNCWTGHTWFSPSLTLASMLSPGHETAFIATENKDGVTVDHVQAWYATTRGPQPSKDLIKELSTVDIYLDSTSTLPVSAVFQFHPEEDASVNIPVEIRFSDYRNVNGVLTPFRIQRFQNGTLMNDVSVTSVVINSGISDSLFSAQ